MEGFIVCGGLQMKVDIVKPIWTVLLEIIIKIQTITAEHVSMDTRVLEMETRILLELVFIV